MCQEVVVCWFIFWTWHLVWCLMFDWSILLIFDTVPYICLLSCLVTVFYHVQHHTIINYTVFIIQSAHFLWRLSQPTKPNHEEGGTTKMALKERTEIHHIGTYYIHTVSITSGIDLLHQLSWDLLVRIFSNIYNGDCGFYFFTSELATVHVWWQIPNSYLLRVRFLPF